MKIFEVNSPHTEKQFLEVCNRLYRNDPCRSIPLGSDIANVFDRQKNSLLARGKAKRWIAYDDYNLPAGRIAAFFNHEVQNGNSGMGFFECLNNVELSSALFQTATTWLKSEGCHTVEAPVNFGEKDRFWGLLTKGFDTRSLYLDNYNPSYYEQLFRAFHFQSKDEIFTFRVSLSQLPATRIERVARRLQQKDDIHFRSFDFQKVDEMAADFHAVYTAAFKEENRIRHLTVHDIVHMMHTMRIVIDEKCIWLAYHGEKPVGLLAFIKDLNQVKNLPLKNAVVNLKGIALSVIPAYHNHGIEAGLCYALYEKLKHDGKAYELYFSGINSISDKMISFIDSLHGEPVKTHKTFILNF